MESLVLDTSAYSNLRRGRADVIDQIASAEVVCLPTIVLGELESGFALGNRYEENSRMLNEFLTEPFVSILPVTRGVAVQYGQLFAELRRAGTPLPVNDIWIAATTLATTGRLLTFDRDFERFVALRLTLLE